MTEVTSAEHDHRDLGYRVRIVVIGEVFDRSTGELVASGSEEEMKKLYRTLRHRDPVPE